MRHTIIKRNNQKKKLLLIAASASIILLIGLAILEVSNTTYIFHKRKAVSSTIATPTNNNKSDTQSDEKNTAPSVPTTPDTTPKPATGAPNGSPKEGDSPTTPTTNAPLIAPYGDFVSNHSPGKNESPTVITSVCNTTPGAQCSITFTSTANPSIVKTLAVGTADSSGSVFWNNWDVKKAGFTNGTWLINAVATLNGKTLTTPDKTNFEVVL